MPQVIISEKTGVVVSIPPPPPPTVVLSERGPAGVLGLAGGVLSGNYPNPGFAADMATQGELNTHTADAANPHAVTKAQVGLSVANNTADTAKPVSMAQQMALNAKLDAAEKAAALGLASLSATSRVAQSPKLHAADHATGGADVLTPGNIGAAPLASPQLTGTPRVTNTTALKQEFWDATQQVAAIRSDHPSNIGIGKDALFGNTVTGVGSAGLNNTAIGYGALQYNTTGANNIAIGYAALYSNTTGGANNIAIGYAALYSNTTGGDSTAIGHAALYSPNGVVANATTTALRQTVLGRETGQASATQRNDIVAVGYRALVDANDTVSLGSGAQALHTGAVALGKGAVSTAADQVMVGARDVEIGLATKGLVLKSPDGARYRVTVATGGVLTTAAA